MKRTTGWAAAGALLGALLALLVWAPASWLATSLADATDGRLLLADARGSVWQGSAVLVLTGGAGSRDASALPGRLQWTLGLDGAALGLRASQACCIAGELKLRLVPGFRRLRIELPAAVAKAGIPPGINLAAVGLDSGTIGEWPASWLVGLGTPWNTLQLSGQLQVSSPGLVLEQVGGHWRFSGRADVAFTGLGSRLSTLDVLGSYRLRLIGSDLGSDPGAGAGQGAALQLQTLQGPLLLDGNGGWAAGKFRFNGQASAAAGSEAVLGNLLNIIGRRQGAVSVISIG